MKLVSRKNGFSLVESLIAIFLLSAGIVLYAKNWTANFGAKNSSHIRTIAASQSADIGNVLLANISDLDKTTPRSQLITRIQQFSDQLQDRLNSYSVARGYECINERPRWVAGEGAPVNVNLLNQATVARAWAQGAATCVSIKPKTGIHTSTNGVWVEIETRWIDAHSRDAQAEKVTVYTLVSPL